MDRTSTRASREMQEDCGTDNLKEAILIVEEAAHKAFGPLLRASGMPGDSLPSPPPAPGMPGDSLSSPP